MNRTEKNTIFSVTLCGLIEFYEIYLYVYWIPVITKEFYVFTFHIIEFITSTLLVVLAALSRPIGGLIFGYLGDRIGRQASVFYSIAIISILSLIIAVMPFSSSWGIYFLVFIGMARFVQGVSAGGELPSAFCLLGEGVSATRRRFLCSFALIGPQLGQILSETQYLLFKNYASPEFITNTGWRVSFLSAALIGSLTLFLRKRLRESDAHIKHSPTSLRASVYQIFRNYKKLLCLAFFVSIFEVAGFFIIAFYLTKNFTEVFNLHSKYADFINVIFLVPILFLQPAMGKVAEKYSNKWLLIFSAVLVSIVSIASYFTIAHGAKSISLALFFALICGMSIQFALLPSLLVDLFPSSVRLTGIGFSFNLCDSVVGGLAPLLAIWIVDITREIGYVMFMYPVISLVFLYTLSFIPPKVLLEDQ